MLPPLSAIADKAEDHFQFQTVHGPLLAVLKQAEAEQQYGRNKKIEQSN